MDVWISAGRTTGVLGVMVVPYHSEHRWSRVGAVYASYVCQFRDNALPTKGSSYLAGKSEGPRRQLPQESCDQWKRGFDRIITGSHHRFPSQGPWSCHINSPQSVKTLATV